jgi:opacity protein-like surface antigen
MKKIAFLAVIIAAAAGAACADDFQWLPQKKLFAPLLADDTYPSFGAKYSAVAGGSGYRAEVNMGDEFGIMSDRLDNGATVQFGAMGGVAARFDISQVTNDLEIADYSFALPIDYRMGPLTLRAMYWHTSSHIGDDYVIANPGVTLSKHVTDDGRFYASYDLSKFLRLYAGTGYAFNMLPKNSGFWRAQTGVEAYTDRTRPVYYFGAADFQSLGRNNWNPSFAVRTGVTRQGKTSSATGFCEFYAGRMDYIGFMTDEETKWSFGFSVAM